MTWQEKKSFRYETDQSGMRRKSIGETLPKRMPFWEDCKKGSLPEEWEID